MSDMREALNAALDAAAEDDETQNFEETPQEVESVETEIEASSEEATASAEGSEGTPAGLDAASAEADKEPGDAEASASKSESKPLTNDAGKELAPGDSIKAPVNWGPKEREDWSKIPRHLQEKVMAREKDMSNMMQSTADARRTHKEFGGLVQQYGSALSGVMGDTPMETVSNLFSTVANLRMGTPIQKAQIVADLIQNFGVDINTLDSAIVGAAPSAQQSQNSQVEQMVNERLAPFEQMMGQQNAYQQQQADQRQQSANAEVQEFGANAEFLSDVRYDMADLIDMASQRGQNISMQEAYDKACAINPQISAVLAERAQRASLTGGNNTMASKRAAASSINGQKVGNGGSSGNMSIHDTIAAAWDSQNGI